MTRCITYWLCLALFLSSTAARAHDARESSLTLRLEPDGLEIRVVLSLPTAAQLVGQKDGRGLHAGAFDDYHAELLAAADRVCVLMAKGVPLKPARVLVSKNHESEIEFLFCHPLPLRRDLAVQVPFLEELAAGHFCEIHDGTAADRAPPKRAILLRNRSLYPVTLPAAAHAAATR